MRRNTADFTAAAVLDERATQRYLYPVGQRITTKEAPTIANRLTGVEFKLHRVMPTALLRVMIAPTKTASKTSVDWEIFGSCKRRTEKCYSSGFTRLSWTIR